MKRTKDWSNMWTENQKSACSGGPAKGGACQEGRNSSMAQCAKVSKERMKAHLVLRRSLVGSEADY